MPASHRLVALAVAISALAPVTAHAIDDFTAASGNAPMAIKLCGDGDSARIKTAVCKEAGYDKLFSAIDKAASAAIAKAPVNVRALLKRDQAWFNEMIDSATDSMPESEAVEQREMLTEMLRQRVPTLEAIAQGFGRPGLSGKWLNVFGSATVTSAEAGAYRIAIETHANYGADSRRRPECKVSALVKPGAGGWYSGTLLPDDDRPAAKPGDKANADDAPTKPAALKLRRQGDTLRVAITDFEWRNDDRPNCEYPLQVTGSYFGAGKMDSAADKADTAFVAPTFDCTRLETASEEEICADPDLANNDRRLNQARKALLPRLDDPTRRALTGDQRKWVESQAAQYPEFLHPAWEKQTSFLHYTTDARDKLDRLQRERIALLDGFDDKRSGLAGTWLAYDAVIKITVDKAGGVNATGWKWTQGDWKAGCDYDMSGKIVGGTFRSDEKRKNPDTLERDHATLIVNRLDDVLAKQRGGPDGGDEPKCKRNYTISSTARLFPARPSPDIDNLGGGSIR